MMTTKRSRIREGLGELPRPFRPEVDPVEAEPEPDAEAIAAEAFEKGRLAGVEEARPLAEKKAAELRTELSRALEALAEYRETMIEEHALAMKRLALQAASRIVRQQIDEDNPVALRAVEEALEAAPRNGTIEVRLHPDDLESVRKELGALIDKKRITLHEDDQLSRGGCCMQTSCGTIDASLEAAEDAVREAVLPGEKP